MKRRWWTWSLDLPHVILAGFMAGAMLYGLHVNADANKRNCASQVLGWRVILQEIKPADGADPALRQTAYDLNAAYAQQYRYLYHNIDGGRCVSMLPADAPPAPTAPPTTLTPPTTVGPTPPPTIILLPPPPRT